MDDGSAAPAPVRAVLFDFGGVLTSPVVDAFAGLSREIGLPPGAVLRTISQHEGARRALVEHETGRLDDEDFETALAGALREQGAEVQASGLLGRLAAHLELDEPMIALVREVRRHVPVALVSNSLGRDSYAGVDLDDLFDVTVISGQVGVRKPSRRIYQIACERLAVAPRECLLVDDLQQNLDGAARLGIVGVLHRTSAETIARLRASVGTTGTPAAEGGTPGPDDHRPAGAAPGAGPGDPGEG